MKNTIPAVSIIIPMYNAEKYIGECLDSILAQTFTDFEVIIVDDCSTDNSRAVVQSYLPKFGDKLQFVRSEKNSGGCPGIPRNTGIRLSCGEYILFVDSDDAITPTALEELYPLAKKFDADVVHCEKFFRVTGNVSSIHLRKDFQIDTGDLCGGFVNEPTLETNDFAELMQKFCDKHFEASTWNKLTRRRLIMEHGIEFPDTRTYQDFIFNFKALCFAEKILRIPDVVYYMYRDVPNSNSKVAKATLEKTLNFRADTIIKGLKVLDDFMDRFEFFKKNLNLRYGVLNLFVNFNLPKFLYFSVQYPPYVIHEILKLGEIKNHKDVDVLVAYLFSVISMQRAESINDANQYKKVIVQMEEYIKKQAVISQQRETQLESVQNYISELQAENNRLKEQVKSLQSQRLS